MTDKDNCTKSRLALAAGLAGMAIGTACLGPPQSDESQRLPVYRAPPKLGATTPPAAPLLMDPQDRSGGGAGGGGGGGGH